MPGSRPGWMVVQAIIKEGVAGRKRLALPGWGLWAAGRAGWASVGPEDLPLILQLGIHPHRGRVERVRPDGAAADQPREGALPGVPCVGRISPRQRVDPTADRAGERHQVSTATGSRTGNCFVILRTGEGGRKDGSRCLSLSA